MKPNEYLVYFLIVYLQFGTVAVVLLTAYLWRRVAIMSSLPGSSQNKGDKKKFHSIDINSVYKGKSVETRKAAGKCIIFVV